jgi:hypothetical protein
LSRICHYYGERKRRNTQKVWWDIEHHTRLKWHPAAHSFPFTKSDFCLPTFAWRIRCKQDRKLLPQPIADGITDSFTHLSHSYDSGFEQEDQAPISLALDALVETTCLWGSDSYWRWPAG